MQVWGRGNSPDLLRHLGAFLGQVKDISNPQAVASPTIRGQWDLILIFLGDQNPSINKISQRTLKVQKDSRLLTVCCLLLLKVGRNAERKQMISERRWKLATSQR